MDPFFTYGSGGPAAADLREHDVENNVFAHSEDDDGNGWHYYSLYIAWIGPNGAADPMNGWVVRNNTFENEVDDRAGPRLKRHPLGRQHRQLGLQAGITFRYNVGDKCSARTRRSARRLVVHGGRSDGMVKPGGRLPPEGGITRDRRWRSHGLPGG